MRFRQARRGCFRLSPRRPPDRRAWKAPPRLPKRTQAPQAATAVPAADAPAAAPAADGHMKIRRAPETSPKRGRRRARCLPPGRRSRHRAGYGPAGVGRGLYQGRKGEGCLWQPVAFRHGRRRPRGRRGPVTALASLRRLRLWLSASAMWKVKLPSIRRSIANRWLAVGTAQLMLNLVRYD